ncbi:MAG: Rrf2 family transcriptional regulator [Bacteroidia bacterium]|nr:Rrf2 family transcriptional regulator [Bacteroidia bacterium]MBP9689123.1 Rrf2 family transcriptional regulator [Bacteroidia bacterium]
MFSKACEYGIRASIYIAEQSMIGIRVNQKQISKAIDSPVAFTAKILQQLTKNNIINSEKGPSGGFIMVPQSIEKVKLSHVVYAIDGDEVYKGCGLGLKKCNEKKPCPAHNKFKIVRDELKDMLETTTIKELTLGLKDGFTFLKR